MNLTNSGRCVSIYDIQGEINLLNSIENIEFAKEVAILWGSNQYEIKETEINYEEKKDTIDLTSDPIKRINEINY